MEGAGCGVRDGGLGSEASGWKVWSGRWKVGRNVDIPTSQNVTPILFHFWWKSLHPRLYKLAIPAASSFVAKPCRGRFSSGCDFNSHRLLTAYVILHLDLG